MDNLQNTSACIGAEVIVNASDPILAVKRLYSTNKAIMYLFGGTVVFIGGALGNVTFLLSCLTVPAMQSSATAFLSNIAFADLFLLAHTLLWGYLDYFTSDIAFDYPIESNLACYAVLLGTSLPYHVSLVFVTLVSTERYLAVCKPIEHRMMKGKKRTYKMIAYAWLIGTALALVRLYGYSLHPTCIIWPSEEEFSHLSDTVEFCESYKPHPHIIAIGTYFIFLLINCTLSLQIISALRNREVANTSDQAQTARNQVTRTLVISNTVFFLCQFPFRITHLDKVFGYLGHIDILDEDQYQAVFIIGYILLLLNSSINPIIYVTCCRMYRNAMSGALRRLCSLCFCKELNGTQNDTSRFSRSTSTTKV